MGEMLKTRESPAKSGRLGTCEFLLGQSQSAGIDLFGNKSSEVTHVFSDLSLQFNVDI